MANRGFRDALSVPGLLAETGRCFAAIEDTKSGCSIPLVDQLMSGLALLALKYPSLLQFDQDSRLR